MAGKPGFFDVDERYASLSAAGYPLERLAVVVDFELFRPELDVALHRADRAKGGRPPYDSVLMFKVLVLQTLYTLSNDRTEYQLKDRLSFMRFVWSGPRGLGAGCQDDLAVPRAADPRRRRRASVRPVRSRPSRGRLSRHGRADRRCHRHPGGATQADQGRERGDQRRRSAGRLVEGQAGTEDGHRRPLDAQARAQARGWPKRASRTNPDRARDPGLGYKNHLGIDRRHGFIRSFAVADAAAHDGRQLGRLLDPRNTASAVWADTAYRSAATVALLGRRGLVPQFQRPKPRAKPMPPHMVRGNASRARVRAAIEHVFVAQKCRLAWSSARSA
jgi:hypothetical protein